MKIIRWLLFLPVSAMLAIVCGIQISDHFLSRSYDRRHIFLSIISPRGLAPEILERFIPVLLLILVGTIIAPSRGRKVVISLGVLGGLFGMPLLSEVVPPGTECFFVAGLAGVLLGCAVGMLLAFELQTYRRKRWPNQAPDPMASARTPAAAAPVAPASGPGSS